MRILLLSPESHPPLARQLSELGHEVGVHARPEDVAIAMGRQAVDVLGVEAEQLASGARWLDELRARARPDEVCVLGLAPSHAEAHVAPLLDAAVDEYLVRPFTPEELRARLVLLERRRSARRQAQTLEASARGEMERLSAIIQTQSEVALAGLDLEPLMHLICERARMLCGAEGAALGLMDGDAFVYRVTSGSATAFRGFRLPMDNSLTGTSVLRGTVLRSDDTELDVRVNREAARHLGIRSMITVPLWREARPVGALNVTSPRPHVFGDRDVRTLELLAGLLGAAMGNAAEFEARQALMAERTAALDALQDAQELFTSFMNNGPALAYMKDSEGRRIWANEPYRRFFKLAPDADLATLRDEALMPPESVEHIRLHDHVALESGLTTATESLIPSPEGVPHYWLTYRFTALDGQGRRFLGGVSLNITERKRAEQALRRSEESFRALIECLPDAIFVHRGGPLLYVNPAALSFLGRPAQGVIGARLMDFVHPEDRQAAATVLECTPGSVPPGTRELRFLNPGGEVRTAEVGCLGLVFDGQPATVIRASDQTERKQLQSRLLLTDRLAAVGTLAAGVAHEINNPLAFVLSNLSFLTEELQALAHEVPSARLAELEEVLREASEGANRVRHIVRDLKTFSRVDEESTSAVSLQAVLDSAITMARGELRQRARLVKEYAEVPLVEGCEGRFGQVFLNLLINAAQAIAPGQPESNEVRVVLSAEGERVIVEVRDTGNGIPPELRDRIFDPFFTTKPVGEGTGLGLSICHGIVTRFGGDIRVDSELGVGSTFRVSFPIPKRCPEDAGPPSPHSKDSLRRTGT